MLSIRFLFKVRHIKCVKKRIISNEDGGKKKRCCLQILRCSCSTLFRMSLFWDTHRWRGCKVSLRCICYTYAWMIILDAVLLHLKKIQQIYKSSDIFFEFCWPFFNQKLTIHFIRKCWQNLQFDRFFLIHLTFSESLYNA